MLARVGGRLTYANVVATVALFIALGGGAYAAYRLPANSVGTKQIKNGAVTAKKIARGAVTAASVRAGSLTGSQIAVSTLGTVPAAAFAANASRADSAANADAIGGVGLSGLLRSDQVLTGSASADTADNLVLQDPRTGLKVLTGTAGALRLVNTNAQDTITGEGIGYYDGPLPTPHATPITLAPGAQTDVAYDAASFSYGHFVFMRQSTGVPLELSCLERAASSTHFVLSCVAIG
jgi:hypothetical protein